MTNILSISIITPQHRTEYVHKLYHISGHEIIRIIINNIALFHRFLIFKLSTNGFTLDR